MKSKFKRLKRFIVVFLLFVFSVCSVLSVSAQNYTYFTMPISQPNVSDDFAYVEVVQKAKNGDYEGFVYLISCAGMDANNNSVGLYNNNGVDTIVFYNTGGSTMSVYCLSGSGTLWNTGFSIGDGTTIQDKFSGDVESVRVYGNLRFNAPQYLDNLPFVFVYGSDNISNQLLNDIRILLVEQQGNTGSIVGSIDSGTNQIIQNDSANTDKITNNQNANTDKITQNDDENTDKITQNNDKNTSEITNGWEQGEGPDTSITDDYGKKDAQLQKSTETGRSETVSLFNSFGSLFQIDTHLYKGLLSVSAIFTELLKIEWVGSILNFALAIGVFAFVIGTGSEVFRSAHERSEERKIDKISSDDERWLY